MTRPIQVSVGGFAVGVLIVGVVAAQWVGAPPSPPSAPPLSSAPANKSAPLAVPPVPNIELPPVPPPAVAGDRPETAPGAALQNGGGTTEAVEAASDPTLPGPQLREWMDSTKVGRDLPTIELKGRVLGGRQPGTVILEVDKRLRVVREGDELSLTGSRPGGISIRVVEVSEVHVRLEIQPFARNLLLY